MFNKELWIAVFSFMGLIIGAGIFAIPYVIAQAGFLTGIIDMIVLTLVLIYVSLCLGEVVLRTKEKHQLTGLAAKYIGKEGKLIMFVSVLVSLFGALIAYSIGSGVALSALFGWDARYWSVVFVALFGLIIAAKLKIFEMFEGTFTPLKILVIFVLVALTIPFIKINNLRDFSPMFLHIPYGVLLFALSGFNIIPSMANELKNKKLLKKAIIIGMIFSAIIYTLFAIAVVGVLGSGTTEIATLGLGQELGRHMVVLGNIFAVLAFGTAFVAVGFALKENFILDYKVNNWTALGMVLLVPLFFVFLGRFSFVKIIEVAGVVGTGIALLSILVIHTRAIKSGDLEPAYKIKNYLFVKGIIILLLIMGIVYEFFRVF